MLKIRDLGINIIPASVIPLGMPAPPGKAYEYLMAFMTGETCPDLTCGDIATGATCPDLTCGMVVTGAQCADLSCETKNTCVDLTCAPSPSYKRGKKPAKKKPAKKPAKKAPAKKRPAKKKPAKRGYRTSGFGFAAVAQLGRQLEEQLRNEH